jgi:hypothetical protein
MAFWESHHCRHCDSITNQIRQPSPVLVTQIIIINLDGFRAHTIILNAEEMVDSPLKLTERKLTVTAVILISF